MPSTPPAPVGSGIREIMDLAYGRPDVIRLELGEPDAAPPPHVAAAARAAADAPRYVPSAGLPELRAEIAASLGRRYGRAFAPGRVLVTQGAAQGISLTLGALVRPGGAVLVPDPGWPNYEGVVRAVGGRPVRYRLHERLGWAPDPDELLAACDGATVLILNSPGNPTGGVLDASVVERVVTGAAQRGLTVLADEVYDELVLDGAPADAARYAPEQVVTAHSFSKTYAMTGWRVGSLVVPEPLVRRLLTAQEYTLSCVSPVAQHAALAALTGPQDAVAAMRETYRRRRDAAVAQLAAAGIAVPPPAGAFYLLMPLPAGVTDSRAAAIELVGHGVALAPGSAFGDVVADRLRASLASDDQTLHDGLARYLSWWGR